MSYNVEMSLKNENQRFIEYTLQIRKIIIEMHYVYVVFMGSVFVCRLDQILLRIIHVRNSVIYK